MAQPWPSLVGVSSSTAVGVRPFSTSSRLLGSLAICLICTVLEPAFAQNIDGGRSELPGMKQDMFDQVQRNKKAGNQPRGKGPPDCPKSDGMSPFMSMAFAGNDIFVRLNSLEGKCEKLISVGGANYSVLTNASRTCGPAGEWKRRIAENMSSVFFQGGLDWVKHDNETIEVVLESGTVMVEVTEHKYEQMLACWKYACGCEQANSPITRIVFFTLLAIAVGGLGYDSFTVLWAKVVGKKPPKHVECKHHCKGHKMVEVKYASNHYCDLCSTKGTTYHCSRGTACNYDLCKACYQTERKKVKAEWKKWIAKHPEDADKKDKKKKDNEEKSDDEEEREKSEKSENEDQSSTKDSEGAAESGKETEEEKEKSQGEETEEKKGKEEGDEQCETQKKDE